ncbi:MAG: hypothetical protein AAF702_33040 [Chloroflexota bacterium]
MIDYINPFAHLEQKSGEETYIEGVLEEMSSKYQLQCPSGDTLVFNFYLEADSKWNDRVHSSLVQQLEKAFPENKIVITHGLESIYSVSSDDGGPSTET